ncbi:MAG: M28 family metallopeptidase [Defluviitaleaceae bacterium]|nr:M28 family metallopeptidase [Defluviitaleaceae bacterium]
MRFKNGFLKIIFIAAALALVAACGRNNNEAADDNGYGNGHIADAPYIPSETLVVGGGIADYDHGQLSMYYINVMNEYLYGRLPFSYRELYAAHWIQDVLIDMGHPAQNVEIQTFHINDVNARFFNGGDRDYSQNVILTIPGQSAQTIVVGAHYDIVYGVAGASDNASGVALLLESAWRMLHTQNYYTLVYVFFGAEEIGLLGADYFVRSLSQSEIDNMLFMVNADVLFEGPYLLYIAGQLTDYSRSDNELTQVWDGIASRVGAEHGFDFIPYPNGMYMWMSDHIPFYQRGITVVFFAGLYDGDWGFTPRVLHSHRDCAVYIEASWPGKMEENMRAFSLLLEAILLNRY